VIRVVREVLELWEGECVVRAARSDGASVTPVARRIETAAGSAVLQRLEAMGELPLGSAVLTPGGDLPVRFLLHVVLQSDREPVTVDTVRRATTNALARAADFGIGQVAFPPLGTHAGQLESDEAAHAMAAAIREHRTRQADPGEIVVVVESEYDRDVYDRIVGDDSA
jgi:O-acetyl-ADP-ribose deacetylase (regulator of RNase III)